MKLRHVCLGCALVVGLATAAETPFPIMERDADGFALATPGAILEFPRDHGSHPAFKTEWWYLTGHLRGKESGKRYGFQLTFFRSAADSKAGSEQLYMAHAALLDKGTGVFRHEERLNTDDWNADAAEGELNAFNGNWRLVMTDPQKETMEARFSIAGDAILMLDLAPMKPLTRFGGNGYSRKGDDPGAASYYLTFTRLAVSGNLTRDGASEAVEGIAWMDHEFSSSQLSGDQVGWNWTSAHFNDGTELMAYVMRRADGSTDPHSTLTLINAAGERSVLSSDQFVWKPLRDWSSPRSAGVYPVEYELSWKTPDGDGRRIRVVPWTDDQELDGKIGGFVYWEGAGQALDAEGNVIGQAYTELTGYAGSLNGKF